MTLTQQGEPERTGAEFYRVKFTYSPDDVADIARITQPRQPIADTIHLVWRRLPGEPWRRYTNSAAGSRAIGEVQRADNSLVGSFPGQRRAREIFTRDLGEILPWAQYLPGLRRVIENAEMNLPRW